MTADFDSEPSTNPESHKFLPSRIGARGRCPFCRASFAAAQSGAVAEQRCTRCQADLWALAFPSGLVFFVRRPGDDANVLVAELAGASLGASVDDIAAFLRGADSLDMVELMA